MNWFKKIWIAFLGVLTAAQIATAEPMRVEHQIDILAQTANDETGWFIEPSKDTGWNKWCYAVTDLDHDGNLEILKARSGFDDGEPCLECEELLERKWERRHVPLQLAGAAHVPDILTGESAGQPGVIYDTNDNRYFYIFTEVLMHGEYDSTTTQYAVSLDDDLKIDALASMEWHLSGKDGSVKHKFYRLTPLTKKIGEKRYINITDEIFPGCNLSGAQIKWWRAEELLPHIKRGKAFFPLAESYDVFIGREEKSEE